MLLKVLLVTSMIYVLNAINNQGINNIILCYHCYIDFEEEIRYPVICHKCTDHKLNRGQFKFTFCSICNKPTSHLGITPLSQNFGKDSSGFLPVDL